MDFQIMSAGISDIGLIGKILLDVDLPSEVPEQHLDHFFVAKKDDSIIGVIGIEVYGPFGLLRSLAVTPSSQGNGIGKDLYSTAIDHAKELGIRRLFLLTTTAEGYFSNLGFISMARDRVPDPIAGTEEFKTLCPETAVCMTLVLNGKMGSQKDF